MYESMNVCTYKACISMKYIEVCIYVSKIIAVSTNFYETSGCTNPRLSAPMVLSNLVPAAIGQTEGRQGRQTVHSIVHCLKLVFLSAPNKRKNVRAPLSQVHPLLEDIDGYTWMISVRSEFFTGTLIVWLGIVARNMGIQASNRF